VPLLGFLLPRPFAGRGLDGIYQVVGDVSRTRLLLSIDDIQADKQKIKKAAGVGANGLGGYRRPRTRPAAATKTSDDILRDQLAQNGATDEEIDILLEERVELNAMPSDDLIEMIERKLKAAGIEKVIPDDGLLEETYRAFHHSDELREAFEEAEEKFKAPKITVPKDLRKRVRKILKQHQGLRWDDAVRNVLGDTNAEGSRVAGHGASLYRREQLGDALAVDLLDGCLDAIDSRSAHCGR
jgi:hypothetical protein